MGRWWRAYDDILHDPKVQRLTPPLFKTWFNLLCIASKNEGMLPPIADIAFELHMSEHKAAEFLTALTTAQLFDLRADGKFEPHNWSGRQFKTDVTDPTNAERQKRYRRRHGVTANTVTDKRPDTEAETDTEAEKNSEAYASAPSAREPDLVDVVDEDPKARLFRLGKPILISFGISEKRTGSLIGQWLKAKPDALGLLAVLQFARDQNVAEPVAYVSALIHGKSKNGGGDEFERRPGESLGDLARRMADAAREFERSSDTGRPHDNAGRH
ncbi:MAG TPA: hypothetical protein VNZ53_22205 [Steroidobacteraceae bacterium]|nr:hypothetical protein [Steroidobacteraceae bacterium]